MGEAQRRKLPELRMSTEPPAMSPEPGTAPSPTKPLFSHIQLDGGTSVSSVAVSSKPLNTIDFPDVGTLGSASEPEVVVGRLSF